MLNLMRRSRIRMAFLGIPLSLFGIGLIFWLKPQSGSTIRGLSLLTAAIQALGASAVVLFFVGLRDYLEYKESLRKPIRTTLDKPSLLKKAFRIGQTCCADTSPNPEHLDEWVENATLFLRGSLLDFLEEHPVTPEDFPDLLSALEKGFRSLLEQKNRNREKNDLSLSTTEILDLLPRVFRGIEEDPDIRNQLEPQSAHERPPRTLPQNQ